MRKIILNLARRLSLEEYHFGACYCGNTGDCFNVGRSHWYCCDKCKTVWYVGSNLFSGWREENQEIWDKNVKEHAQYEEIDPILNSIEKAWHKSIRSIKKLFSWSHFKK